MASGTAKDQMGILLNVVMMLNAKVQIPKAISNRITIRAQAWRFHRKITDATHRNVKTKFRARSKGVAAARYERKMFAIDTRPMAQEISNMIPAMRTLAGQLPLVISCPGAGTLATGRPQREQKGCPGSRAAAQLEQYAILLCRVIHGGLSIRWNSSGPFSAIETFFESIASGFHFRRIFEQLDTRDCQRACGDYHSFAANAGSCAGRCLPGVSGDSWHEGGGGELRGWHHPANVASVARRGTNTFRHVGVNLIRARGSNWTRESLL
jgi:hypothetical protein